MLDKTDALGLVLSGGGAKGAYQAGVVRCLAERGVRVSAVSGSSIGALNGAVIAGAPNLEAAAARLAEIWRTVAASPPAQLHIAKALPGLVLGYYLSVLLAAGERSRIETMFAAVERLARAAAGRMRHSPTLDALLRTVELDPQVLSDTRLTNLISRYLDDAALGEGLPFYVSAFRSRGVLIDLAWAALGSSEMAETPDAEALPIHRLGLAERRAAILASAAIPMVLEAQSVDGEIYVDGGLGGWRRAQGSTPAAPLVEQEGCSRLIIVHASDASPFDRYAFPGVTILEIRPTVPIVRRGGWRDVLAFEPQVIEEWMAQGYADTAARLDEVGAAWSTVTAGRAARDQRNTAVRRLLDDSL